MTDLVMTWASGEKFCRCPEVGVFLRSLERSGFDGDKLVLTTDMTPDGEERFRRFGFEVMRVPTFKSDYTSSDFLGNPVVIDRNYWYWFALGERERSYGKVFCLDCKDVLFQRNPSQAVDEFTERDDFLLFASEGMLHQDSAWNGMDQLKFQSQLRRNRQNFLLWPVLNAGIYVGSPRRIREIALAVWAGGLTVDFTKSEVYSDQAIFNYLIRQFDPQVPLLITHPSKETLIAHGDAIRSKFYEPIPEFRNGILYGHENAPFAMFHQWDRMEFKDEILAMYED